MTRIFFVVAAALALASCTSMLRWPLVATPDGAVPAHPPETSVPAAEVPWPDVHTRVLPNGLFVHAIERPAASELQVLARVRGAGECQSAATAGIASLTAMMMRRGSRNAAGELFWPFRGLDEQDWFRWTRSDMELTVTAAPSAGQDVLAAAARTLRYPAFDARWLDLEREQQLVSLRESRATAGRAYTSMGRLLFGDSSPFARSGWGEENYLARVTPMDLTAFHRSHYVPENIELVVMGPIDAETMFHWAELAFADWPRGGSMASPLEVAHAGRERPWEILDENSDHAEILFAVPYSLRTAEDRAAFETLSILYGGMFDSWLNGSLREADGSTYFTTAASMGTEDVGALVTRATVALDRVESVVVRMRTVADRLVRGEANDRDLQLARALVRARWIERMQSPQSAVDETANLADAGRTFASRTEQFERARTMDSAALAGSASRIFHRANSALVLAGPSPMLRPVVRRAWEPISTPPLVPLRAPATERPPRTPSGPRMRGPRR